MSNLLELAERCEKAEGPGRELDAIIAATCRLGAEQWEWANSYPNWIGRSDGRVELEKSGPSFAAPAFTASLDAALTLVREGYGYEIVNAHGKPYANVWKRDGGDWDDSGDVEAASPALALCAAALCALASQEDQSKAVGA